MIGAGKLYATADNQAIMHVDRSRRPVDGVYLRPGVAKGVKVVRNYGNPTPALVLDGRLSWAVGFSEVGDAVDRNEQSALA